MSNAFNFIHQGSVTWYLSFWQIKRVIYLYVDTISNSFWTFGGDPVDTLAINQNIEKDNLGMNSDDSHRFLNDEYKLWLMYELYFLPINFQIIFEKIYGPNLVQELFLMTWFIMGKKSHHPYSTHKDLRMYEWMKSFVTDSL